MVPKILLENPLFKKIPPEKIADLLTELKAQFHTYQKAEFILHVGETPAQIGIVVSGSVNGIQEDFWGNRTILTHLAAGELFAEAFVFGQAPKMPISVIAAETTQVLLIRAARFSTGKIQRPEHFQLLENLLAIVSQKNIQLTKKMEYLSQRKTRDKLLAFLSAQAMKTNSHDVQIPFDRQGLADFLCVERSALSRELAQMKKAGLIDYQKNQFTLLANPLKPTNQADSDSIG